MMIMVAAMRTIQWGKARRSRGQAAIEVDVEVVVCVSLPIGLFEDSETQGKCGTKHALRTPLLVVGDRLY